MKARGVSAAVLEMCNEQMFLDNLLFLISPQQFEAGRRVTDSWEVLDDSNIDCRQACENWATVFAGVAVIVNRKTKAHTDSGAWNSAFDVLYSLGTHSQARFRVEDLNAEFQYPPGTCVAVCGKTLTHEVSEWSGGERICFAHFMKESLLKHYRIETPTWVRIARFTALLDDDIMGDINRQTSGCL